MNVGLGTGVAAGDGVGFIVGVGDSVGIGVGFGVRVRVGAPVADGAGSFDPVGDAVAVGATRIVATGVDAATAVAVGTNEWGRLSTVGSLVAPTLDVGGTSVEQAVTTSEIRPTSRQRRTIKDAVSKRAKVSPVVPVASAAECPETSNFPSPMILNLWSVAVAHCRLLSLE